MPAVVPLTDLTETLQRVRVPSYIVNRDGEFVWINDAAESIFGDLVGRHYSTIVAPGDRGLAAEQFQRKLAGAAVTDYELDVLTADGRRLRAEISSVPLRSNHAFDGVFGTALRLRLPPLPSEKVPQLTQRQKEVLCYLGEGASTNQIAEELGLSRETIRNYVRQVLRAFGAHSRLEAVAIARREGVLTDV
jgi:PAS domain S-box-containing protein